MVQGRTSESDIDKLRCSSRHSYDDGSLAGRRCVRESKASVAVALVESTCTVNIIAIGKNSEEDVMTVNVLTGGDKEI